MSGLQFGPLVASLRSRSPQVERHGAGRAVDRGPGDRFGGVLGPHRTDQADPAQRTVAQALELVRGQGRDVEVEHGGGRSPARTGPGRRQRPTGVSHGTGSSPQAMLTARPRTPNWAAVSVAPTVPECSTDRPVLSPWLMPETTRSGRGPNPSMQARMTARAGVPSIPKVGDVGQARDLDRLVGDRLPFVDRPTAAAVPL